MAKRMFVCSGCGAASPTWVGRCSGCGEWNTMAEVQNAPRTLRSKQAAQSSASQLVAVTSMMSRRSTGIGEFDRVLGGGLAPGSVTLLVGAPGSGKSTLMLQVCSQWAAQGLVLVASGEESAEQVGDRAARLGVDPRNVLFMSVRSVDAVREAIEANQPGLVVVDSVQTMVRDGVPGMAGGVAQVRAVAELCVEVAKASGTPIVLIGHVTKEGDLAGPRTLEHLVDTVVTLDGDRNEARRFLRVPKHRFGPTGELGVLDLRECGMADVVDPSREALGERDFLAPGSALTVSLDGARPLLAEVQTLAVERTEAGRVSVAGLDARRVEMVLAVLARWCQIRLFQSDVFVATVGGLATREPLVDLAIALALASGKRDRPTRAHVAAVGEIGLGGELRADSSLDRRVKELARLGFTRVLAPAQGAIQGQEGMTVVRCATVQEALAQAGFMARSAAGERVRGAS